MVPLDMDVRRSSREFARPSQPQRKDDHDATPNVKMEVDSNDNREEDADSNIASDGKIASRKNGSDSTLLSVGQCRIYIKRLVELERRVITQKKDGDSTSPSKTRCREGIRRAVELKRQLDTQKNERNPPLPSKPQCGRGINRTPEATGKKYTPKKGLDSKLPSEGACKKDSEVKIGSDVKVEPDLKIGLQEDQADSTGLSLGHCRIYIKRLAELERQVVMQKSIGDSTPTSKAQCRRATNRTVEVEKRMDTQQNDRDSAPTPGTEWREDMNRTVETDKQIDIQQNSEGSPLLSTTESGTGGSGTAEPIGKMNTAKNNENSTLPPNEPLRRSRRPRTMQPTIGACLSGKQSIGDSPDSTRSTEPRSTDPPHTAAGATPVLLDNSNPRRSQRFQTLRPSVGTAMSGKGNAGEPPCNIAKDNTSTPKHGTASGLLDNAFPKPTRRCWVSPPRTVVSPSKKRNMEGNPPTKLPGTAEVLQCGHCNYRCIHRELLNKHVKRWHGYIGKTGKYRCTECAYVTNNSCHMKMHWVTHTGERPFPCDKCVKAFTTHSALVRHLQAVHYCLKPYKCDICSKMFSEKGKLDIHQRIHSRTSVAQCEKCGKQFLQRANYIMHMQVHDGVKPHKCQVCPARFPRRTTLIAHMRLHTGEKPFACPHCEVRFHQINCLKQHIVARHTHNFRHRCVRCGKGFLMPSALRRHINVCKS